MFSRSRPHQPNTTPESLMTEVELDEVAAQLEIQTRVSELLGARTGSSMSKNAADVFEHPYLNVPVEGGFVRLLAGFDGYQRAIHIERDAKDYETYTLANGNVFSEIAALRRGFTRLGERPQFAKGRPDPTHYRVEDQTGARIRTHNRLTSPQLVQVLREYDADHFRAAAGIEEPYTGPVFEEVRQRIPEAIVGAYAMHAAQYPGAFGHRYIA